MGLLMGCGTWHCGIAPPRKISDFPLKIKHFGGFPGNVFAAEH
jgi:hypothetical protein